MKKNLLFAGHDLKFSQDLIEYFSSHNNFNVRIDQWEGHSTHNEDYSIECLNWADTIFCEWGLGNAVWYSLRKEDHQKLFVRMHRQELVTDYPNQFNLSSIDRIIAISPYIYEEFYRTFGFKRHQMTMIFNHVNVGRFNRPKIDQPNFNLGMIGINPKLKRLDRALDVFEDLWKKDNRYKLYIKGKMPQEYSWLWNNDEQREYYEGVFERIENSQWKEAVIFEGFGDVGEWLTKVGFILSVSDLESFHLAVAEGMASGAIPIVYNWQGAQTIYTEDMISTSIDDMIRKIEDTNQLNTEAFKELQNEMKTYSKERFSFDQIVLEYEKLLNS